MSLAADPKDGSLTELLDTWAYSNASTAHGIDIREIGGSTVVYSTDLAAGAVWAHKIDRSTGRAVSMLREQTEAGSNPRHLRIHPGGKYLYVLMGVANVITEYSVNENSGMIGHQANIAMVAPPKGRAPSIPVQRAREAHR
jgi:carboxy-cis,cis-muconate cyclase